MLNTCDYCGKTLVLSGQKTKRFCNTNCRVLWHYHQKIGSNSGERQALGLDGKIILKPMEDHVYDPKNVPGVASFKDKNGNVEFGFHHGLLDDRTNYYRGKGKFGYERMVDEISIE